jgi:circadian clock protein KaiB
MKSRRQSKLPELKGAVRLSLRLYVAGQLPHSLEAIVNLRRVCAEGAADGAEIEIVDLLQEPERGLADGILVTPTLVRLSPEPVVKIFGALSDPERVSSALGFKGQDRR